MGHLYVIKMNSNQDLYKIGISKAWEKRSKALSINKKTYCCFLAEFPEGVENYIEKELHNQFKKERLPQSEWFVLNCNQIAILECLLKSAVEKFNGTINFNINKEKSKENCEEKLSALEDLYWHLEDEVGGEFFEHQAFNPFLQNYEVEYDPDLNFVEASISFVEPDNTIGYVSAIGEYCDELKKTRLCFGGSANYDKEIMKEDHGDWYKENYGIEDFCIDDYLNNLYERLQILTLIPKHLWPSKVFARMVSDDQRLAHLLEVGSGKSI